jgi:hypothetical protein
MVAKKKGAGGKLSRSEIITVRLDPKLRFAAELAARKQRRTLSSFVEWAIEEAVRNSTVSMIDDTTGTVWQAMMQVWDVEEADRLVKLAINFPELLTFDEERLWKIISENPYFWDRDWNNGGYWNTDNENFINYENLESIPGSAVADAFPQFSYGIYAPV